MRVSIDEARNQNLAGAIYHFVLGDAADLSDLLNPPIVDSYRAVVEDPPLRVLCDNPFTVLQK